MLNTNDRMVGGGASILLVSALVAVSASGLATHFSDAQDDLDDECRYLNTRPMSEFVEEETGVLSPPSFEFKDDDACDENTEDAHSRFEASPVAGVLSSCPKSDLGGLDESPVGPVQPDFSTGTTRCPLGGVSVGDGDNAYTFEGDDDTTDDPDDVVQNVVVDVDFDSGIDLPIRWRAFYEPNNDNDGRDARGGVVETCATTDPGSDDVDIDVRDEYGRGADDDVTQIWITVGAGFAENPCGGGSLQLVFPPPSGTMYYDWEH